MFFRALFSKPLFSLYCLLVTCFFITPLLSSDELSVKSYHVPRTFLADIKERMPLSMAKSTYRESVKEYLQQGGNPNLSFPRSTEDTEYEWGFLHLAVAKTTSRKQGEEREQHQDIAFLRWLITMKVDINQMDSQGRSALHLAAYSGPGIVIDILLHEGGANPLCFDHLRLLPSDYHVWSHFFNELTHYKQSSFQDAEKALRSRYAMNNPQQGAFMHALQSHCEMTLLSHQLLQVNMLAKNKATISVSGFFNAISSVLPSPLATGTQALAVVVDVLEDSREERRRQTYVEHAAQLFNKETVFKNLVYFLATLYGSSLQELTEEGARKLGEYAAKKVNKYMESEAFSSFFFIQNVEKLLSDLKGGSILPTKVEYQNGISLPACEIFNPALRQVKKAQPTIVHPLLLQGGVRYDKEEEMRLKILVGLAEPLSPRKMESEKILDLSTYKEELLPFLQNYPPEQALNITSLNLSYHRITPEIIKTISRFSSLRELSLKSVEFHPQALTIMRFLSHTHLKTVDWRQNSRTLQSEVLLSHFSGCLKEWKERGLTVSHAIDNDILYRLGKYHEARRELEEALSFYELGSDASNSVAFYKLSTQRPRRDDPILQQEYDCLAYLVAQEDIKGYYLMGQHYKSAKKDRHTLRTLRAKGVIDEKMNDDAATQYLREQADHLYRLAAEGGHTRAAQSIAHSIREAAKSIKDIHIKRQLLQEELKYWKIAVRGTEGVEDESVSKVESAPENIAKIEAALYQLTGTELK
jgi:hypothetical protein